jgi:hypothetical protein
MSLRFASRALLASAALFAATACSSDSTLATAPGTETSFARGSSTTPAVNVAGTWSATLPGTAGAADSTQWSLYLTQRDDRLEGSLIRILYVNGTSLLSVSAIRRGFITGTSIGLEFDRGEGAETATTFSATVSDDRTSMTGFHSRYANQITLRR